MGNYKVRNNINQKVFVCNFKGISEELTKGVGLKDRGRILDMIQCSGKHPLRRKTKLI